ncbi:T9SS type A sorting domain-containing protein, partial [Candidatus Poribacteria bacterium]|nr:T9SS type A sorting domain-containing protein [Candidatus Poribacteria bacterium]
ETSHLGPFWIDTTPPTLPTDVVSSSHKAGIWSSKNGVDIKWSTTPPLFPPQSGGESLLRGYSIVWDRQPFTLPPAEINVGPAVTVLSTPPLVDGVWYLHLRLADVAGNWTSDAVPLGPFQIDTHPPNPPSDLRGVSHQVGVWSNRADIELEWRPASDETSGIKNYLIVWDTSPDTHPTPDANPSLFLSPPDPRSGGGPGNVPKVSYRGPALVDGDTHYVHLRVADGAGLMTDETLHLGPFRIDTTPPGDIRGFAAYGVEPPPTPPLSPLPSRGGEVGEVPLDLNKWLTSPQMTLAWQVGTDSGSGVAVYEITRVRSETGEQQTFRINADAPPQWTPADLSDGAWVFRIRAGDNAGNWGAYSDLTLKIDTTVPTPVLSSPSHPNSERWYADANPIVEWTIERDLSGIAGYLGEWSAQPDTIPQTPIGGPNPPPPFPAREGGAFPPLRFGSLPSPLRGGVGGEVRPGEGSLHSLPNGIWYFHLRAIDNAGNRSEVAHYKVQIDRQVPETPIIRSRTHPPERWSKSHIVDLRWDEAPTLSGAPRYNFALDHAPDTIPDTVLPSPSGRGAGGEGEGNHIEQALDDGIWYFHLKAISRTGIGSETAHYRIQIDSQIATPVIRSPSHADSTSWYANPSPVIEWTIAGDLSGIAGYFGEWDAQPNTIPQTPLSGISESTNPQINESTPSRFTFHVSRFTQYAIRNPAGEIIYPSLPDGIWYFHLRAIDNAGNLNETAHYQVRIDASAPNAPAIQSGSHPAGVWRSQSAVDIRWNVGTPTPTLPRGQGGGLSGMAGYSFVLDQKPTTLPDERIDGLQPQLTTNLADGIWYFHLRAQSNTGLWSETAHYEIRIDTHPPEVTITLPRGGEWFRKAINEYAGEMRDELSGIDETTLEYRYAGLDWKPFVNEASSGWLDTDELPHVTQASGTPLQVRVRDRAGNVGMSEERLIRVDVEPPSLTVTSPTHPQQGRWYADPNPVVEWTVSNDLSGIADYFWVWDKQPDTIPRQGQKTGAPESQNANESKSPLTTHHTLTDDIWYFHLIALDNAGNPSEPVHYRFQIDTQPPKGTIRILRPEVIKGRPKSVRYLESKEVPPRVSSGEIRIVLTLSEETIEPPKLFFQPSGMQEIALALGRSLALPLDGAEGVQEHSPLQWHATLQVSPHTGDGMGKFRFVGADGAGNLGGEIAMGPELVIDTLIHADETEVQHRIGDNGAIVTIPPRALRSDVRLHLEASPPSTGGTTGGGTSNRYRLIAWDGTGHPLPNLTFAVPIELQLPIDATQPIGAGDTAYTVLYNDGVGTHRIGTVVAGGQAIAPVSQIGEFLIAPAPKPKRKITGGWAAPNPFTPNPSGDASDRTIFHVQTRGDDVTFTIEIYDLTGRRIRTLRNGLNVWDGADESGQVAEGGVYIYQIHAGDEVISGTVVVVR